MFRALTGARVEKSTDAPSNEPASLACAVLIDQGTLILVGRARIAVPSAGTVRFVGGEATESVWHAMTWPIAPQSALPTGAETWFLAVLRFDNIARIKASQAQVRGEDGRTTLALPEVDCIELEALPLLERLREASAPRSEVFDFLRKTLLSSAEDGSQRVRRFLAGLLRSCSRQDGFVEILGRPECGGLIIQGWSLHLAQGAQEVFLESAAIETQGAMVATFERGDLIASAPGVIAYLRDARADAQNEVRRVYFRAAEEYFHLDIVENRVVHAERESAIHVKEMLDRLQADVPVMRALRRVCRPRFEGKESVSTLPKPVRAAQDIALAARESGIFVSGWLLDPLKHVHLVLLKSTANFYARIDEIWHRTPRPDISQGFADDPLFHDCLSPADDHYGFMVFVAREAAGQPDEQFYLELVLEDGSCGFLPLSFAERGENAVLRQLLNGVNVEDPGINEVISRHIGPIASATAARRLAPQSVSAKTPFGNAVEQATVSVVIPILRDRADFDINLARLADDADFHGAEMIVVAPRTGCDRLLSVLRKYAAFYGMGGRIVFTAEPLDDYEALEVGARAATAEALLFMSPNVFPRDKGWLSRLGADFSAIPKAGAISPTLLYEDYSIRFAGTPVGTPMDLAEQAAQRHAGYPSHWLESKDVVEVRSGTAECCLMQRRVFLELGGFGRDLLAPELKSLDFALRLERAGFRSLWSPSVMLYALDDDVTSDNGNYWLKPARLVDRWSLERKWFHKKAENGPAQ